MKKLAFLLCLLGLVSGISIAQEQTPYDIALERILEAEASGATYLSLSYLGLPELPSEIGNLPNLTHFNVSNNEFPYSLHRDMRIK